MLSLRNEVGWDLLGLEVEVNLGLRGLGEASLGAVVLVAKVMAVASRQEGEAERVVRGAGAAIRGPVQRGRVLLVATGRELGERQAEEELVGDGIGALSLGDARRRIGDRRGDGDRGQSKDSRVEFHDGETRR